jgi:hypothetical protein
MMKKAGQRDVITSLPKMPVGAKRYDYRLADHSKYNLMIGARSRSLPKVAFG